MLFRSQAHDGGGEHGEALASLFGQTFGGDLAKDEDDNGKYHCGDHRTIGPQQVGEQGGGYGGGGDVYHVVADEDGGEEPIIVLRKGQGPPGTAVPPLGPGLHADPVEGGKGGLGGREEGGESHQEQDGDGHGDTGTVHRKWITLSF